MPAGDAAPAWTWDAAAVGAHVARQLGVTVTGAPVRLTGGLLNVVWRVPVGGLDGDASVIVKVAPPFVASAPDVPLPASRLRAEARALAALPSLLDSSPRGGVPRSATERVRTPRLLDLDAAASVLVMSDAGDLPHLGTWLAGASAVGAGDALARLGAFVGRLHGATLHAPDLTDWHQPEIARVRLDVQYHTVEARLAGVPDAAALGAVAADLGERWLAPGLCVVMGDLWPPSVLVGPPIPHSPLAAPSASRVPIPLTVIDWELCTAGEPAQDLGHLAAHLWLLGRMDLWAPFVAGYRLGAGDAIGGLLGGGTAGDAARHAACELLARVTGPFGSGRPDAGSVVATAADWLRAPDRAPWATATRA